MKIMARKIKLPVITVLFYFISFCNCGYNGNSTPLDGRQWFRDEGRTNNVVRSPELQTRQGHSQSTNKQVWFRPWGALRKTKKEIDLLPEYDGLISRFTISEMKEATKNFSLGLGRGGFGAVYKGRLPNGPEIAVKKIARSSGQGVENYQFTCKLQHRNIVRFLGFCFEGEEKLLVHEFLPNKSLDNFLFDPTKKPMLDWSKRQKIIGGIARGLHYLHHDFQPRIIHCDLKASNILLDANMNPKIADFGFARIMGVDQSEGETTITRSAGIFGYMPPECALYGIYLVKSDVYSFGILVLEIIFGKKCTVRFHQSDSTLEYLISYVWRNWRDGTPLALIDPAAGDSYDRNEVIRCIHVALLCIQDVELRPTMTSAVIMLDSNSAILPDPQQPAELLLRTQLNETESITESGPL